MKYLLLLPILFLTGCGLTESDPDYLLTEMDVQEMFESESYKITDITLFEKADTDDAPEWFINSRITAHVSLYDSLSSTDTTSVILTSFDLDAPDERELYSRLNGAVPWQMISFNSEKNLPDSTALHRYRYNGMYLFSSNSNEAQKIAVQKFKNK